MSSVKPAADPPRAPSSHSSLDICLRSFPFLAILAVLETQLDPKGQRHSGCLPREGSLVVDSRSPGWWFSKPLFHPFIEGRWLDREQYPGGLALECPSMQLWLILPAVCGRIWPCVELGVHVYTLGRAGTDTHLVTTFLYRFSRACVYVPRLAL